MAGLGQKVTPEEVKQLIQTNDFDGDNQINFDEFLCLMVKTLTIMDSVEEELVVVFQRFDSDGDGQIGV